MIFTKGRNCCSISLNSQPTPLVLCIGFGWICYPIPIRNLISRIVVKVCHHGEHRIDTQGDSDPDTPGISWHVLIIISSINLILTSGNKNSPRFVFIEPYHEILTHVVRLGCSIVSLTVLTEAEEYGIYGHTIDCQEGVGHKVCHHCRDQDGYPYITQLGAGLQRSMIQC